MNAYPTPTDVPGFDSILAALIEADERAVGQSVDISRWTDKYPQYADQIRSFFVNRGKLVEVIGPRAVVDPEAPTVGIQNNPGQAEVGQRIRYFGDYELLEEIARGGMGVVFKARQVSLNRVVALKMILTGSLAGPSDVQRFHAEAEAAANLDHPHIVPIYEVGEQDGQHYFSMKLIEGSNLSKAIARFINQPQAIAQLMASVARAVHHAHLRGILHRDLKPANILLDAGNEPHVTDFGLARQMATDSGLTQSGAILGTPSYMSPEQASGQRAAITTASDVYGIGAILYEVIVGPPPFRAASITDTLMQVIEREPDQPRAVNPLVDRDLETICLKCLNKDPRRRYDSAESLAEDLDRRLKGEPIQARPISAGERVVKWAMRRPAIAALLAVIVVLAIGGLAGIIWQWSQAVEARDYAENQSKAALEASHAAKTARDQEAKARRLAEVAGIQEADARKQEAEEKKKAVAERDAKQAALVHVEGLRLAAESAAVRPTNPGLGILLGLEGVRRSPEHITFKPLYQAFYDCVEKRTIDINTEKSTLWANKPVTSVTYSPDGLRLLTTSESNTAKIWDSVTGKLLLELDDLGLHPVAARFTPDGARVVVIALGFAEVDHPDGKKYLYTDRMVRIFDAKTGHDVLRLRGHTSRVVSVELSRDGKMILTASWDGTARLWDVVTGKEIRVFRPSKTLPLLKAQFSPDGRRVLTLITNRGEVAGYDNDSQQAGTIDPEITPGAVEGQGSGIMSYSITMGGETTVARIYDVETGKELVSLWKSKTNLLDFKTVWHPTSAAFDSESRRVAITFSENTTAVWDVGTGGKEIVALAGRDSPASAARFSRDNSSLLLLENGILTSWNMRTGLLPISSNSLNKKPVRSATLHPTDGRLILGFEDTTSTVTYEHLLDLESTAVVRHRGLRQDLNGHTGPVVSADFSPDGKHVATAGDASVRIWDLKPQPSIDRKLTGHTGPLVAIAYSPDGRRLLTAAKDDVARIWDIALAKEIQLLGKDKSLGELRWAEFSADGRRVATASRNATVKKDGKAINTSSVHIWDAETGADLLALPEHKEGALFARISPDGRKLITVADGGTTINITGAMGSGINLDKNNSTEVGVARVWDTATGKLLSTLPSKAASKSPPCFHPHGHQVLVADHDALIARIYDVTNTNEIISLQHPERRFSQEQLFTTFSPNGQVVVTASAKTACVWDSKTGVPLATFQEFEGKVLHAAFSTDSKRLAVAAGSNAYVWDVSTRKLLATLKGHEANVVCVQFSPDGKLILTSSEDKSAATWDAITGRMHSLYLGHEGSVALANFSPDGLTVATGATDGTARLWPISIEPMFMARLPRGLTDAERIRYDLSPKLNSVSKMPVAMPPPGVEVQRMTSIAPSIDPTRMAEATAKLQEIISTKTDPETLRRNLLAMPVNYPSTSASIEAAKQIKNLPSAYDSLGADNISPEQRFAWQPKELVAVLGDHRRRHWSWITHIAYLDGGRQIISGGHDNVTRLWNASTFAEQTVLSGRLLRVSSDCKTAITAEEVHDRFKGGVNFRIWDLSTLPVREIRSFWSEVRYPLAISPDLKTMVTQGRTKSLLLQDISGSKPFTRETLPGHDPTTEIAVFSTNGRMLASFGADQKIRIWDLATQPPRQHGLIEGLSAGSMRLAFSPDGKTLAFFGYGKPIQFYDISGAQPRLQREKEINIGWTKVIAFSPDGKLLAANAYPQIKIYHMAGDKPREHKVIDGPVAPDVLVFSPDGTCLSTGGQDGVIRTWNIAGDIPRETPNLVEDDVISKALFSPDCSTLVTTSNSGVGKLWELSAGKMVRKARLEGAGTSAIVTQDGKTLITASQATVFWDMTSQSPRIKNQLQGHTHGPAKLATDSSGRLLASVYAFPDLRLWDLSGQVPRSVAVIEKLANGQSVQGGIAISPDGSILAIGVGQFGKSLLMWRIATDGLHEIAMPELENVKCIAFSPDGKTLAIGSEQDIELWDLNRPAPSRRISLKGHSRPGWSGVITSIKYDGEGQRLVSSGWDGRVIVWDAATGRALREWKLPGPIHHVDFATDGRHLVTTNGNGTAYILRFRGT